MYSGQHATAASSPLAAEEQRLRKAHYSKRTAENLAAVGLIDPPRTSDSRDKKKRTKAGSPKKARVKVSSTTSPEVFLYHYLPTTTTTLAAPPA